MRKRQALIRVCQREMDRLAGVRPISLHEAYADLTLRCDDWRGAPASPCLSEAAAAIFCSELRDWYDVPPSLGMRASERGAEGNRLRVRLELYDADAASKALREGDTRKAIPPSAAASALIMDVLGRLSDTPGSLEKGRLPDLAEHYGCTYVAIEVEALHEAVVDVLPDPNLVERVRDARRDFFDAQRELDALGASNRAQKWAKIRKWHFIEGAVSWLKGQTTPELGMALKGEAGGPGGVPTAKAALEKKVASRMRWEAVKTQLKVQAEQQRAVLQKQAKLAIVDRQVNAAARELLASMLLEASYSTLNDLSWRQAGLLDLHWNLGIDTRALMAVVHLLIPGT